MPLQAIAIAAAGGAAGAINSIVGSGSLVSFPVLLAFGYPPVVANVSNTVGLVPGSMTGAVGYRRELAGQSKPVRRFGAASLAGAIAGALLLLVLPAGAFGAIVPVVIGLAVTLVVVQPWLVRTIERRETTAGRRGPVAWLAIFGSGVYGGYFSAAQGVLLLAALSLILPQGLQRSNAVKNVLQLIVNVVAALVFVLIAHVAWAAVGLIAAGSLFGGMLGAAFGRHLPAKVLRALVVAIGIIAIISLT